MINLLKMTKTSRYIDKKVKILNYRSRYMIGKIGIIKYVGAYPNTVCHVKVDNKTLKFRGFKHLKFIDKIDLDEDEDEDKYEDYENDDILNQIFQSLIGLKQMK